VAEIILPRRRFLLGLGAALVAAPAIVRATSLMAIRPTPRLTPTEIDRLIRPPMVFPDDVALSWPVVPGAITYHVYRSIPDGRPNWIRAL
jgi:hypothetical protein